MQFLENVNMKKHRNIKLVTPEARRNYSVSADNHTTKFFSENLLAIITKVTGVLMNKPIYLGISILKIRNSNVWVLI